MKKSILIVVLVIAASGYSLYSCRSRSANREKQIAQTLSAQVDSFEVARDKLLTAAESPAANEKQLQELFLQTRLAYKKFEWAAEYFNPAASRFVNGPPVQEIEMSSGQVFEPAGLQVIEGYLFPKFDAAQKPALIQQLKLLQTGIGKYKGYFTNIDIFNWQVFDAAKQELFRVLSLGITGFDNPLTLRSSDESAVCLQSLGNVMALYEDTVGTENLPAQFNSAIQYLRHHTDFNSFDRAAFITNYGNPITTSMSGLEAKLNFHITTYNRLLNQDAKTMFAKNAFNPNAFTPGLDAFATPKRIALGRVLFSDPVLSGNGTRSCQTCQIVFFTRPSVNAFSG